MAGVGGVVARASTEKCHVLGGRPVAPPQHPSVLPYCEPVGAGRHTGPWGGQQTGPAASAGLWVP
eukprot:6141311-Lingulodinium_polyedra.AAC.1